MPVTVSYASQKDVITNVVIINNDVVVKKT